MYRFLLDANVIIGFIRGSRPARLLFQGANWGVVEVLTIPEVAAELNGDVPPALRLWALPSSFPVAFDADAVLNRLRKDIGVEGKRIAPSTADRGLVQAAAVDGSLYAVVSDDSDLVQVHGNLAPATRERIRIWSSKRAADFVARLPRYQAAAREHR